MVFDYSKYIFKAVIVKLFVFLINTSKSIINSFN